MRKYFKIVNLTKGEKMDIDEISGPRVPAVIHPEIATDEAEPVQAENRVSHIKARTSPYEDLQRWNIEDRVTISPEARRRYKQMRMAKKNNSH
ncbi:MAG: hypothetical protein HY757_02415 [Nitrospirae bacterium]|nr:hypothetical protein [Nitrospirota bacterium]